MGLGLTGAYGVAGAYDSLDKILAQRMLQRQYADKMQQQQFENQRQTAGDARADQALKYTQERQASLDKQTQMDKEVSFGNTLNESIPGGTFLPQGSKAAGMLRTAGVPLVDAPARAAMGPEFQGPMPGDAAGPETPQEAQVGRPAGFLKTASQKQIDTNTDNARQADAELKGEAAQKETIRHNRATEAAAVTRGAADKLTKVEHRDPTTGRTVIEWLPQSEIRGQKFDKGASGATETRLASAQAVNQTGDDIIRQLSDPAMAARLGPVLGRYSKLQDFVGNPPPEFSELAGTIESYALANMGVHGMRSAQGAQQIKQLMDGHHTADSLISSVKGLNKFSTHFMENEGRGAATKSGSTPQAPPGYKYVPKPGGGWTAVEDHQ